MLTPRPRRAGSRGLSTMEVLAGMGLTLILLAALYSFRGAQLKATAAQNVYSDSQNVTRSVIDLMARELRMASYDPGTALPTSPAGGCAPQVKQGIIEATPNKIHFQQDLNGDNAIGAANENVTYDVSGTDIRRTDGNNAPVVLATGNPSEGLAFQYFDMNGAELVPAGSPAALTQCQRDSIWKVRVTVRAQLANPNPNIATRITSVAESEVAIRSRARELLAHRSARSRITLWRRSCVRWNSRSRRFSFGFASLRLVASKRSFWTRRR